MAHLWLSGLWLCAVIDAQLRYANAGTGALHACDNKRTRLVLTARFKQCAIARLEAAETKAEVQNVSLNQTSPMPGGAFIAPGAFASATTCCKNESVLAA